MCSRGCMSSEAATKTYIPRPAMSKTSHGPELQLDAHCVLLVQLCVASIALVQMLKLDHKRIHPHHSLLPVSKSRGGW